MSPSPPVRTTLSLSPSREHTFDPVGLLQVQGGCMRHDHEQILGHEYSLMEISEVEYTQLQHLIQSHMEANDAPPPAIVLDSTESTAISPFRASQAIDLSISTDEHRLLMAGEKTPVSYGEVPGFVLARIQDEDSPTEPCTNISSSSLNRSRSAARVCLEKRFNVMAADNLKQQQIKSAVLSNFLTMFQQSAEVQEAILNPQAFRWIKTDRENPSEVSSQFVGDLHNSGLNSCEKVIDHILHMDEPDRPRNAASAAPDSAGGTEIQKRKMAKRRERHNMVEKERRKRIRLYCDELNMLVPFCENGTDKVRTLQWTTAFVRYIKAKYGDTPKKEFEKAFAGNRELFQKSSNTSDKAPIKEESSTPSIPIVVEQ